ncbi:hypothetical protein Tcan_03424 [Toxocara canis]|uniref:Uncharacterized protein n=1 Tax=Toxocara canis TaxID=6265 RepID=A0A0B2VJN4_TOXCA|nr:hypothetical protein Tcan_03424 [Toxocara canis]
MSAQVVEFCQELRSCCVLQNHFDAESIDQGESGTVVRNLSNGAQKKEVHESDGVLIENLLLDFPTRALSAQCKVVVGCGDGRLLCPCGAVRACCNEVRALKRLPHLTTSTEATTALHDKLLNVDGDHVKK